MNNNNEAYISCNGETHVPPVLPVPTASWGPEWLSDQWIQPRLSPAAPKVSGWQLPNGTVLCADCHPFPQEAVPVTLQQTDQGQVWVEELPGTGGETDPSESGEVACSDLPIPNLSPSLIDGSAPAGLHSANTNIPLGEGWL